MAMIGDGMTKIGIFLGSFDPVHIGHINIVREALKVLDKVIVVPTKHNPWKGHEPSPFDVRCDMTSLAILPFGDRANVSDIEGTFDEPYYSYKTLEHFKNLYEGEELYLICGSDTAPQVPYWKNAEEKIMPFYNILSFGRNIDTHVETATCVVDTVFGPSGKQYEYMQINIDALPISSTQIRKMINNGETIYPLVPHTIENIIKEKRIYEKT